MHRALCRCRNWLYRPVVANLRHAPQRWHS